MNSASEQWNWGPGFGAEEFGILVGLESSNGLELDKSECLNTCYFMFKAFLKRMENRLLNVRINNCSKKQ